VIRGDLHAIYISGKIVGDSIESNVTQSLDNVVAGATTFIEEPLRFDKKTPVPIIRLVGVLAAALKNLAGVKDAAKLDPATLDRTCVVCGNMVEVKVRHFHHSLVIIVWYVRREVYCAVNAGPGPGRATILCFFPRVTPRLVGIKDTALPCELPLEI
jgi:hypothetical protein